MDITTVTNGIICQQVNCQGVMGAGLAKTIKDKWSKVFTNYRKYYKAAKLGQIQIIKVDDELYVANFFAQDRYGRDKQHTDYEAFASCLLKLRLIHKQYPGKQIYFPYKIGCGLAGGSWSVIKELIETIIPEAIICKK